MINSSVTYSASARFSHPKGPKTSLTLPYLIHSARRIRTRTRNRNRIYYLQSTPHTSPGITLAFTLAIYLVGGDSEGIIIHITYHILTSWASHIKIFRYLLFTTFPPHPPRKPFNPPTPTLSNEFPSQVPENPSLTCFSGLGWTGQQHLTMSPGKLGNA